MNTKKRPSPLKGQATLNTKRSQSRHSANLDDTSNRRNGYFANSALDGISPRSQLTRMTLYIKEWRCVRSLTQEQLGNIIGKHFSTVQKWEKGVNKPNADDMDLLAKALEIHPLALFFHPNDEKAANRLTTAHDVLTRMTPDQADHWLKTGQMMIPPNREEE